MDKLETLYDFASASDIDVINRNINGAKKSACMHLKPYRLIIMDHAAIESRAEETALLAEEIGHYRTGGLYIIETSHNTPMARNNRIKYEAQAMQWAYKHFLTQEEIEAAYKAEGPSDWPMAEYCQVTVEFLHKAIEYHRSCGVVFSFTNYDCA